MTAPQDLDASPVRGDLRRLARRHAGLLTASAVALAWMALARRQPDTTYHVAPIIVAASSVCRVSTSRPSSSPATEQALTRS